MIIEHKESAPVWVRCFFACVMFCRAGVISPKGRCRAATEGCRLRLRKAPTVKWLPLKGKLSGIA